MMFTTVMDDLMDDCHANLKQAYCGYLDIHQQMNDLMISLLPGMDGREMPWGTALIQDWFGALDKAFVALQSFHSELLDDVSPDKLFKKDLQNLWRQFGFAGLEETRALRDRLHQVETQLVDLKKQDRIREITEHLENSGKFLAKDALAPFEKALSNLKETMTDTNDVETLRLTVSRLENDLGEYMDEIDQVKTLVGRIQPEISKLADAIDQMASHTDASVPHAGQS